jgi:hypothetical protein
MGANKKEGVGASFCDVITTLSLPELSFLLWKFNNRFPTSHDGKEELYCRKDGSSFLRRTVNRGAPPQVNIG